MIICLSDAFLGLGLINIDFWNLKTSFHWIASIQTISHLEIKISKLSLNSEIKIGKLSSWQIFFFKFIMIYFHYIILFCLFYLLVFYFSFFKHAWFLVIQVELWEGENWRSINYGVLLAGVLVTPWIIVFCKKRIWSFLSNDWIPFENGILHLHCGTSNSNRCRRYIYSIWSIF